MCSVCHDHIWTRRVLCNRLFVSVSYCSKKKSYAQVQTIITSSRKARMDWQRYAVVSTLCKLCGPAVFKKVQTKLLGALNSPVKKKQFSSLGSSIQQKHIFCNTCDSYRVLKSNQLCVATWINCGFWVACDGLRNDGWIQDGFFLF